MTKAGLIVLFLILVMSPAPVGAGTLLVPAEYPTIQAAVDSAATGDEIVISAGVYVEQVVITKDLTLTGAGSGQTVLQAPVYMPHVVHFQNYNAVIHAEAPASMVALRDLSVDGAGRGRVDTRFTGIMFYRSGGSIERIEITNLHETPISDSQSGIGVYSYSEAEDDLDLFIDDLVVTNFQKSGYVCAGRGCRQDVRNTVVDASGLYSDSVQNGFELLNASSGSLTNCTARDAWYDGTPYGGATSCGFLIYYAEDWSFEGCFADKNQSGIYNIATDLDLRDVTVVSYSTVLNYNYGIVATGPSGSAAVPESGISYLPAPYDLGQPRPLIERESAKATNLATVISLDNCTLTGIQAENVIGVVALSELADLDLTVENSSIAGWGGGIWTSEFGEGWVVARARSNRIQDNLGFGAGAATRHPFDARGNFWGDATGPFHAVTNPAGTGNQVGDNVVFDPWLQGNIICGPVPQYIAQSDYDGQGYSRELDVRYLGGGSAKIYGFSIELLWDQSQLTASVADVARPDIGHFQNAALFQVRAITGGLRVDGALGGMQPGTDTGSLFRVRFHLVDETDYQEIPILVKVLNLRDNQNREISGWTENDGLVIGDLVAPVIGGLKVTNNSLPHTDSYAKNGDLISVDALVTDEDPLFGVANIVGDFVNLLGLGGWLLTADTYALGEASWLARSVELYPADGMVPYGITATDPAGNVSTAAGWIVSDNTPPQAISGLVAERGHNQVSLTWDDPEGLDANFRQVVVRSNRTDDYPDYSGRTPGYPIDPADGQEVYTGPGTSADVSFAPDGSERGILYFQAFAVDVVNLFSVGNSSSRALELNYRLADVTAAAGGVYDGLVDIHDVTYLGDTFGAAPAAPAFNGECDVGPTVDGTTGGVPQPDGAIDIEDLMVFADAFERDLNRGTAVQAVDPLAGPDLFWRQVSERVWVLELVEPCAVLKGLRLVSEFPDDATAKVSAGDLLRSQEGPYFLHSREGMLDVSLAVLGNGVGIEGTGVLLRVETSRQLSELPFSWDARGLDNSRLPIRELPSGPPLERPSVFALHGSHPNPFNPETTIVFDLPSSQPVEVVVYGLDGRRVAGVLKASLEAGRQRVAWRGRDDSGRAVAAGVYMYRVQAGPWSATGKVVLVK